MQRLISVVIVSTIALASTIDADACGDKTLRVGSGIRYYRSQAAQHPSAVLIHMSAVPGAQAPRLNQIMKDVGHRSRVVDDLAHLAEEVKSGQYDLVLIDVANAAGLQSQAGSSRTVVVPVMYKRTKAEQKAAGRQFPRAIVKNPTHGEDFLEAVWKVMTSKRA